MPVVPPCIIFNFDTFIFKPSIQLSIFNDFKLNILPNKPD